MIMIYRFKEGNKLETKRRCCRTKPQTNLYNRFRMLWEQHDVWTRETISGIVFELPNLDVTITRLLRNPVDMANVFRIFYGQKVAMRIQELFTTHLTLAADLVNAAKAGDERAVARINREWFRNADEIAAFLARINPFWSLRFWEEMMHHHLKLVTKEAVFLLEEQYEKNVRIYDEIEAQTLEMADEMARGIIRQFHVR